MNNENKKTLLKTILIFIIYIFYTNIATKIFSIFGITNDITIMFSADILFLIIIVSIYFKKLKQDFIDFNKNYDLKQKIWIIIKYVVLIFIINFLMGIITQILIPSEAFKTDANANQIGNLFELSTFYTLFKTLIFASFAEELLFRESIHEVVKNKRAFVIISATIYTAVNIIYNINGNGYIWIDFIAYLLDYLILSYAYLKNNNNIFIIILIKLFFNIIPTLLLILQTVGVFK